MAENGELLFFAMCFFDRLCTATVYLYIPVVQNTHHTRHKHKKKTRAEQVCFFFRNGEEEARAIRH